MNEPSITNEERRKRLSHHIVHDYVNLVSAGTEIARIHPPPLNSHLLYSFVVHYRKFAYFFANKERRAPRRRCSLVNLFHSDPAPSERDVELLAKNFVGPKIKYDLREWWKWKDHMDTHLFHLNSSRTRNSRSWEGHQEVKQMLLEFQAEWKVFFDALPPDLKEEFAEEIELKLTPPSEFANLPLYRG